MTGFKLKLRQRNIPKDDLAADLKRIADEIGSRTITAAQYSEKGKFGATTMLRRFGSWNEALTAAGLDVVLNLNVPEAELFENLAEVWSRLGKQPVGKDIDKSSGRSKYSLGTYEKRFGSWNKALLAFENFINGSVPGGRGDENVVIPKPAGGRKAPAGSSRTTRKINWRLRAKVLIRDNCICKMCGNSPAKDPAVTLHVDHIKPWSKGGETEPENLQTLCSMCNIGKSDETLQ